MTQRLGGVVDRNLTGISAGDFPVSLVQERLSDWLSMAAGAFAANTLRARKADWEIFGEFCRTFRLVPLPAIPKTVRDFVSECLSMDKKPATIRRYVSTIGRAHRASGVSEVGHLLRRPLARIGHDHSRPEASQRGASGSQCGRGERLVIGQNPQEASSGIVEATLDGVPLSSSPCEISLRDDGREHVGVIRLGVAPHAANLGTPPPPSE